MAVFDPKALSSGVYNPIVTSAQNRKPSTSVAQASPGIYSAAMKTGLNDDESRQIENWAIVSNQHKELMKMNNTDAQAKYDKLDQNVKGLLDAYYGVNYGRRPEGGFSTDTGNKILGGQGNDGYSVGDLAKSPMRALFAAGEAYGRAVNSYGRNAQLSMTGQEVKLDESFSNEAIFNPEYTQPLIEKYGGQRAFVAMSLLKGMTPGEIIDAWGPNDATMLDAVGEVFDNSPEFNQMLGEFEKSQLSPGRTIGHNIHKKMNWSQENHPDWIWKAGTGAIDLTYQLLIDPTSWFTFGGSAAARLGFTKAGKAQQLLKGSRTITEHFADPKVSSFWTGFSKQLGDYGTAVKSGDTTKAAELRMAMKDNYPEYANDGTIELFTKGKYDPVTGQTVAPITDLESAKAFFSAAENTSLLARGRVTGLKYQREGIATMQRGRNIKTAARLKTRELFKGKNSFDEFNDKSLDELADELATLGATVDGTGDFSKIEKILDDKKKSFIYRKLDYLSARHPGNKEIYVTDEKYMDTLDLVREQAFVSLGDKRMAEAIAIKFANSTEAERIALRKALDETTMRRMGVDKVSGGEKFMTDILNRKYGVTGSMSATSALTLPARANPTGEIGQTVQVTGTLLPYQNTTAIGSLPWTEIKHFMADRTYERTKRLGETNSKADTAKMVPTFIGGALNHRVTDMVTDLWTTFTLAPRLGIRTAIDEGMMFSLYMTTGLAKEFIQAKRAGNIIAAATGDVRAVGPIKNGIQGALSKFPGLNVGATRKISKEERAFLENKYEDMALRGEIEPHQVQELYKNDLIDLAVARVGKRFTKNPEYVTWLKEAVVGNMRIMEDASAANFADVASGKIGAVLPEQSLMNDSQLTVAMKELGASDSDIFQALDLSGDQLYLAMFHNFVTAFATKPYKLMNGERLSPAMLFIKYDGLKSSEDWAAAKSDFMQKIGFGDIGEGRFTLIDEDLARDFLSQSRQNLDDGRTLDQIASSFADATFSELTYRFHGSADNINENFVSFMKSQAIEDGTPKPGWAVARDMSFEEYRELVGDFKMDGRINTPLDFGPQSSNLATWAARVGMDKIFSYMTRTTDDLFRQPVVHAHYFMYRKQYSGLQDQYKKQIQQSMTSQAALKGEKLEDKELIRIEKRATQIAARYFTEHAMEDAVHHTLKYSDNPQVRTMFAHNTRTIGRFYRAVEDFHRRMYRLTTERGIQAVYRARLMQQGLSGLGSMHRDENGEQYLVMPMDDAVFYAVDTVLSAYPGWNGSGVRQPLYNDVTMKLTAGNPSFQDDAGVPYLSGPVASLSVLGVQAFLNKFDVTKEFAADIDNTALGNLGDNMDIRKAVVPRSLDSLYKMMSYDEINQQEVSAAMQAIAYNQANGYGIYPDDPKYTVIDANGNVTKDQALYEKDLEQYQKDVQITAHNVLWMRNLLGLISPITPQLKETKDLPTYLKDNGVTSVRSSFFDILDEVERFYPAADDHYELALATWTGKNRGKLVYMPSRNENGVIMSYSKEMQDWMLKNNQAVEKYGTAAALFAPKVGEFTPGVYNWAKAAELINLKPVEDYLSEVTLQDSVNKYFDLDDEETRLLEGMSSADSRRTILQQTTEKKRLMKMQIPALEGRIANMADNEEKTKFLSDVYLIANDPDVDIDPATRESVNQAYDVYNQFLSDIEQDVVRLSSNSSEIKRTFKTRTLIELEAIAAQDESGVVKELLRSSIKGLMNAKSRDAQNTIK